MQHMTKQEKAASLNTDDIVQLLDNVETLQAEVIQAQRQLAWFKKQLFGQKSERRIIIQNPQQLHLSEVLDVPPSPPASDESEKETGKRKKGKKHKPDNCVSSQGLRFDTSVPVKEIHLPIPVEPGKSIDDYDIIGENIFHRLAQHQASYEVLKFIQPVVKEKFSGELSSPLMPAAVFEKSMADVSFIAGMVIDKLVYHLPLYRQHQRLAQAGITLSRGFLTQLMQRVGMLLKPIYQAQFDSVLQSHVIAMDETYIKAGKKAPGKLENCYFWPIAGDRNEIVFPFANTRSKSVVPRLLCDFKGILLSDGYNAYAAYVKCNDNVQLAQCWVHTRRKFLDAEDLIPDKVKIALEYIRVLYEQEEWIRDKKLKDEKILQHRALHSRVIVEKFFDWLQVEAQAIALLPKDDYTTAVHYALKRKTELSLFLSHADLVLDTNHVERALRPIPVGRRNWLFCWTEAGAETIGILQSLLATCKMQNVNFYDYLVDVLQRIDQHPASKVEELTPRLWKEKFADNPLRSLLHT